MFDNTELTIAGAEDVFLSSPADGQTIQYNSSTAKWNNATPTAGAAIVIDPEDTDGLADGTLIAYTS